MKQKTGNLILEIERIQTVRRKCKTVTEFCGKCQDQTNFISLPEAASLFGVQPDDLLKFIQIRACHLMENSTGEFLLCLNSLLSVIRTGQNCNSLKMIKAVKE